jgi:omega-hydroxy-beta-dihydromenaquinone-9 sulfotransferase
MGSPEKPRDWAPRFWEGADFFAWLRLLARNRFAVEPPYWYIAGIVSFISLNNTILRWIQTGLQHPRQAEPAKPPLFVLGHWRTGTTLLHELLVLDERFTSPTTHHCFNPCHYLMSEELFQKYLGFLLPSKRPMDRMVAGWSRPQEDEFALCLLGEPSTYADIAFPNRPTLDPGSLDLSSLTPAQLRHWKRTLKQFVSGVSLAGKGRPVVLKSPPHTARIRHILDVYPDAKFIHIRRDPYTLYASTLNLWKSMAQKHGLQTPQSGALQEEKVFREFRIIYERLHEDRELVPASQWVDVRYEDLVADLMGTMQTIYQNLQLEDFDHVRPKLQQYINDNRNYETNKFQLTAEQKERITQRWGDLIRQLGYPTA